MMGFRLDWNQDWLVRSGGKFTRGVCSLRGTLIFRFLIFQFNVCLMLLGLLYI